MIMPKALAIYRAIQAARNAIRNGGALALAADRCAAVYRVSPEFVAAFVERAERACCLARIRRAAEADADDDLRDRA